MKGWPFLISASPYLEYQPIILPEFIRSLGPEVEREVIRSSSDAVTNENEAIYLMGYHDLVGVLDTFFRVTYALGDLLGGNSNEILRDKNGRSILVIEGLVFNERFNTQRFTSDDLSKAHDELVKYFPQFWNTKQLWTILSSKPLEIISDKGTPLLIKVEESPNLPKDKPPVINPNAKHLKETYGRYSDVGNPAAKQQESGETSILGAVVDTVAGWFGKKRD